MRGKTHVKIGMAAASALFGMAAAGTVALPVPLHPPTFIAMAGGSVIGSLLPDNDAKRTTISHFLPVSNKVITKLAEKNVRACYHRHLLHSLLFLPMLTAYALYCSVQAHPGSHLLSSMLIGALVGMVMHILADTFVSRTWLLYPLIKKPFTVLNFSQAEHADKARATDKACSIFSMPILLCSIGYCLSFFYGQ